MNRSHIIINNFSSVYYACDYIDRCTSSANSLNLLPFRLEKKLIVIPDYEEKTISNGQSHTYS